MKWNIKQIVEGYRNKLFPPEHLKELIEHVAGERKAICDECPHNSSVAKREGRWVSVSPCLGEHCMQCGCCLDAKQKCLSCECPLHKWLAVSSEEENEEIKSILNE
jgi:hypothetical protein